MGPRNRSMWLSWAMVGGAFGICCGLPILALVLAAGGLAALLTGLAWLALGAMALAAVLGGARITLRKIRASSVASGSSQGINGFPTTNEEPFVRDK